MLISVIIPAYNEKETVGDVLLSLSKLPLHMEIIFVDDGSEDGTGDLVKRSSAHEVKFLRHPARMGKGTAVRTGLTVSRGDVVVIQDADLEYDPADIPALVEPVVKGEARVVYGRRMADKGSRRYRLFFLGSRMITLATNLLFGTDLRDQSTGYKIFNGDLLRSLPLRSRGFEFCAEVTALLSLRGVRIVEKPISYKPRGFTEGKKLRWRDGLRILAYLFYYRLTLRGA
jgi:glycosyltransferase involved in cell wall biosynthesis